jgi:hypothetical protein
MKTIKPFTVDGGQGELHIWAVSKGFIMVSHEDTKTLRSFATIDDAIYGLWLTGFCIAARELNKVKESIE